jgi:hypothetical protein
MPGSAANEQANFLLASTYTWISSTNLLAKGVYGQSCVAANNYIYCMGGGPLGNGNVVQYSSIAGGAPGTWTYQNPLTANMAMAMEYGSCVTANNYIYCMGGMWNPTVVQYASIASGPPTSAWTSQTANTLPATPTEDYESCVTANNYIYCMGANSAPLTEVEYAPIYPSGGNTGPWTQQSSNVLNAGETQLDCVTANNYIYCMGGGTSNTVVQYAPIYTTTATTGAWQSTNSLAVSDSEPACVTANNYIYCMGDNAGTSDTIVQGAPILPNGAGISGWTSQATNTLAYGEYTVSCVTANNYIYCPGGYYYSPYTQGEYAQIPT